MSVEWTEANDAASREEGWYLYDSQIVMQWLTYLEGRFADFADMYAHLVHRARAGSPLHLKALAVSYPTNTAEVERYITDTKLLKTIQLMARMG